MAAIFSDCFKGIYEKTMLADRSKYHNGLIAICHYQLTDYKSVLAVVTAWCRPDKPLSRCMHEITPCLTWYRGTGGLK